MGRRHNLPVPHFSQLIDWKSAKSTLENYLRRLVDTDSGDPTPHASTHDYSIGADPLPKPRAGANITITFDTAGKLGPLYASTGGGSGLTHPQVMVRVSLRF
jgi:hypothetical protein